MRERLVQSKYIGFLTAGYDGQNHSGIHPIGDFVCVLCDVVDENLGSGLLVMTPQKVEEQNHAVTSGIIVAMGPDAFLWSADRMRPFGDTEKPKLGDRVIFVRYSGEVKPGLDDKMYRVLSDNSIVAIMKENENG